MAALGGPEVYPVGLLRDLQHFARGVHRPRAARRLWLALAYPVHQVRAGNWRAVKNYFNGYLAEPAEWSPEVTRCGSGWTRHRARRDWDRRVARA